MLGKLRGGGHSVLSRVWMITASVGLAFVWPADPGVCVCVFERGRASLCFPVYIQECTYSPCLFGEVKEEHVWGKLLPTLARSRGLAPRSPTWHSFPSVHVWFQDKSLHSLVPPRARRNDRIPHPCLASSRTIFDSVLVALALKARHFLQPVYGAL